MGGAYFGRTQTKVMNLAKELGLKFYLNAPSVNPVVYYDASIIRLYLIENRVIQYSTIANLMKLRFHIFHNFCIDVFFLG